MEKEVYIMEEWKIITGFEDYEISSFGRVKSHKNGKTKILKERFNRDGYVQYSLSDKNHVAQSKRASRLVAEAFIRNPENKPTVNHKDGNKRNNRVDNLEWATKKEQMKHAYKFGLKQPVSGTLHGSSVLSESDVVEIRKVYKPHDKSFGMFALAKKYNVSPATIDRCVRKISYKNIK